MSSDGGYKLPKTGLFMDHSKSSEATISALEASEARNHLFPQKKKKKSRLLNHVLFLPRLILHPRRLGKRVRSSFQRKTKNARDSARDDPDECHPSDINTAVSTGQLL